MINYSLNGKAMIIRLIVGSIKKILLYKMSYFPEPYTRSKNKIKVDLDLSNNSTKDDLKNVIGVEASYFSKKTWLASLKTMVDKLDKLDVDKLKPIPTDLKKLSDAV